MKALKILKDLRKAFGKHDKSLEEAISELEALQQQTDQVHIYLDLALKVSSYQDTVEAIKQAKKVLGAKQ